MRLLLVLAAAVSFAATLPTTTNGWRTWAPRPEIAPRTFLDPIHHRTHPNSLAVSGNGNAGEHGGWEYDIHDITPNRWYRFTAYYQTVGVAHESLEIMPRVDWKTAANKSTGRPDYPYKTSREGDWNKVTADLLAPQNSAIATLQLFLFNSPQGTVWWDDISLEPAAAPAPRPVTIATVNLRPSNTKSSAESVRQFVAAVDHGVTGKADIILLPEGITIIGTGKSYVDVSETIPGPTTATLGELARRHSSYVVAGIYEREGEIVYNTAVLINRQGAVVGKYRKVYLPATEIEGGLTPGNDYPVFHTDFGTVGLMICYDVFYSDPAHALARKGAEVILLPIWGGDETLAKARAIENQVYLVTSGYDHPTYIMDPRGERIASAPRHGDVTISTVDLNQRWWDPQLGDMRARRFKEERVDVRLPGRE